MTPHWCVVYETMTFIEREYHREANGFYEIYQLRNSGNILTIAKVGLIFIVTRRSVAFSALAPNHESLFYS